MEAKEFLNRLLKYYSIDYNDRKDFILEMLSDLKGYKIPSSDFKVAYQAIKENEEFFPRLATMIKYFPSTEKRTPIRAWEVLVRAIDSYGGYDSYLFEDPKIPLVVEILWGSLEGFYWSKEDRKWQKKDFCQTYESIKTVNSPNGYLKGHFERVKGEYKIRVIGENKNALIESHKDKLKLLESSENTVERIIQESEKRRAG